MAVDREGREWVLRADPVVSREEWEDKTEAWEWAVDDQEWVWEEVDQEIRADKEWEWVEDDPEWAVVGLVVREDSVDRADHRADREWAARIFIRADRIRADSGDDRADQETGVCLTSEA